ncbi:hypothetical protein C0995_002151 [Termitomyces sp. Mi166|nr:hypothetical protein C0995_002151 [Termitomyces sp. Mi166\
MEQSHKKRKTSTVTDEKPSKKSKKEKRERKDKQDKGKARDSTEFHVARTSLVVSIPPTFAGNPRAGVEEILDSMVMRRVYYISWYLTTITVSLARYLPALRGVVLSHSNLRFLSKTATIQADCPFLVCPIEFDATIWSPRVGMKLMGKISLSSPDHVSLLLHRTFNVSIPRHHIPKDEWEFEYGPAENDPEYGTGANTEDTEEGPSKSKEGDEGGRWVHHLTRAKLGDADGYLTFTVIGLTVANEMLSLLGSMQSDPFSPEHVPESGLAVKASPTESEAERAEVQNEIQIDDEDESDSDEDTFKTLGKMSEDAAAQEKARRLADEEAALADKEKKRKRKAEMAENKKQKRIK